MNVVILEMDQSLHLHYHDREGISVRFQDNGFSDHFQI